MYEIDIVLLEQSFIVNSVKEYGIKSSRFAVSDVLVGPLCSYVLLALALIFVIIMRSPYSADKIESRMDEERVE